MARTPPGPVDVDGGASGGATRRTVGADRASSAEAFSTLGYHGVSMGGHRVARGISAAALYRHYSSKYELFRGAAQPSANSSSTETAFADGVTRAPIRALCCEGLVAALADTALANRESGGLYHRPGFCAARTSAH